MKVDALKVAELFKTIRYFLDGINETIQSGDDGFQESCEKQIHEVKKQMNIFTLEHLEAMEDIPDNSKYYLKDMEKVLEKLERDPSAELSQGERIALFKHNLYNFLKRTLQQEKQDLSAFTKEELITHIECYISNSDGGLKLQFYNHYVYSGFQVVTDLVEEIIKNRKKFSQQKMF